MAAATVSAGHPCAILVTEGKKVLYVHLHTIVHEKMVAFYESEGEIWFFTFLLISVIFPAVFFALIWKADKPAFMDLDEVLRNEESQSAK